MILCSPSNIDAVFLPIAILTKDFVFPCSLILSSGILAPSGVKNSTTSRLPFVIVPVLSLKRIFNDPAVSIPTAFLTRTL